MDLNSLSKKNFLGAFGGGGKKTKPFLGFGLPPESAAPVMSSGASGSGAVGSCSSAVCRVAAARGNDPFSSGTEPGTRPVAGIIALTNTGRTLWTQGHAHLEAVTRNLSATALWCRSNEVLQVLLSSVIGLIKIQTND